MLLRLAITCCAIMLLTGCGYSIRRATSEALEKEGIHRIYLAPVVNDTYHYGVENVVYNAMVRSLASFKAVQLVNSPELADAVLTGRVVQADSATASTVSGSSLRPGGLPKPDLYGSFLIAYEYNAVLSCSFQLTRREAAGPKRPAGTVWAGTFSRSKIYPASNQLGVLGTSSGLINDSEFDRTIVAISRDLSTDVREAMISRF